MEKPALSKSGPEGQGDSGPSVCGDHPANLPPTVHLTSECGFQPGRWGERAVPGVGGRSRASQPQQAPPEPRQPPSAQGRPVLNRAELAAHRGRGRRHPLAPSGWSKVGREPTGAGGQEMEFKAHSKRQRRDLDLPQDGTAPPLSSFIHRGGLLAPAR